MNFNPEFKVKYCPKCGESLLNERSLLNEYWDSENTVYFCWCHDCSWTGEVNEVLRVVTTEPMEE